MATFRYNALTPDGRLMDGTIESASQAEASEQLQQMQLRVNSIDQAKIEAPKTSVGRNEFLLFNQQLASLTKAGIPLERGLRELAHDITSRSMRQLVTAIADDLESGVSIEDAFEKRQKAFPPLYGRILKAGVETGRLSEMLTSLNRHLEMSMQTRRIIFEAFTYPGVVFVLTSVIVTGVFIFIIPQFREILHEMVGGRLNPLTQFFLGISQHVASFWLTVGGVVLAIVLVLAGLSTSPSGRRFRESLLMRIPMIGRVYRSSILSRMAEAMAMMVASGSDMPACLRLAAGASGSEGLILESEAVAGQVEQGGNILEASTFCKLIPRLFFYSMQLGSQRNELQDNLHSLGQMYGDHARCSQARLQAILLPLMIILLGGFIGLIVISMFLPMVQVVTSLSS